MIEHYTTCNPPTPTGTPPPSATRHGLPGAVRGRAGGQHFYDYIRCLACRGIVGGYPCGGPGEPCPGHYFRPGNNVTRGQVSKIVAEPPGFADPVPSTQQTFEDVPPGSTFWLWIERLRRAGHHRRLPLRRAGRAVRRARQPPLLPPQQRRDARPALQDRHRRGGLDRDADRPDLRGCAARQHLLPLHRAACASRGIISGYPCGGAGEPCVAPANRPYFRPSNNATRGQTAKIVAATFFPGCEAPRRAVVSPSAKPYNTHQ